MNEYISNIVSEIIYWFIWIWVYNIYTPIIYNFDEMSGIRSNLEYTDIASFKAHQKEHYEKLLMCYGTYFSNIHRVAQSIHISSFG